MIAVAASPLATVGCRPVSASPRRSTAGRSQRARVAPLGLGWLALSMSVGCSGDRAGDQRQMIAALTAARDQACACPDLACADAAERRLADFLLRRVDRLKKVPPPRAGVVDPTATTAAKLDSELRACKQRLLEAARAS